MCNFFSIVPLVPVEIVCLLQIASGLHPSMDDEDSDGALVQSPAEILMRNARYVQWWAHHESRFSGTPVAGSPSKRRKLRAVINDAKSILNSFVEELDEHDVLFERPAEPETKQEMRSLRR